MSGDGRVLLARDGTFAALTRGGGVTGRRGTSPDGLFRRDTRHLSRWRLTVDGAEPAVLVPARDGELPAACVLTPPGARDAPAPYTVFREQAVASGVLLERLRLVSNRPEAVTARLELLADADFADQFELRSDGRTYARPADTSRDERELPDGVEFTYRRGEGWLSRTTVRCAPPPDEVTSVPEKDAAEGHRADGDGGRSGGCAGGDAGRAGRDPGGPRREVHPKRGAGPGAGTARRLAWTLALPPHGTAELTLRVEARPHGAPDVAAPASPAQAAAELRAGIAAFTNPPAGPAPATGPGTAAPEHDRLAGPAASGGSGPGGATSAPHHATAGHPAGTHTPGSAGPAPGAGAPEHDRAGGTPAIATGTAHATPDHPTRTGAPGDAALSPAERAALARACAQGLADLALLRVPAAGPRGEALAVPGAGIPWFLTVFGRDSVLTSLFALPYRPALARDTLLALAAIQGTRHDAFSAEQPGRIAHEVRHGELAAFRQVPYGRYYGSVDVTPLFLVLLQAYAETTADTGLAARLEPQARAAVGWMLGDGGLGERGWLVYTPDPGGLVNQNWKDSAGAICFADGSPAEGPVAVAEAQGYAYDALVRTARLARGVWGDAPYADRLDAVAAELRDRFHRDFWLPDEDFPALALDGRGRRVDALASDAGHLLWSGILDGPRGARTGRRLLAGDFFSGWAVRTLAAGQLPYHPLSYHRGSCWPHDNAVIALGLARYGLGAEVRTLTRGLLATAQAHGWRLPEVLAGYGRSDHPAPVPYPHACSPQAWAAATPLALLTAVSGGGGT
ncbi:aminotransferase [Streptomyces sp. WMMC500]|uniref:amylo-alpha-1,6-glucosidase n=1 Tax=Streptomyces sp. WMMC500 TaxID=3015154 RepID=UPI00248C48C5|nr:glycogen debranching N-terminal domain-containing protein [Streptomyces sp. WMMC500]WBB61506.1 aminotransferase [Streptomyces sp. WMMC500]